MYFQDPDGGYGGGPGQVCVVEYWCVILKWRFWKYRFCRLDILCVVDILVGHDFLIGLSSNRVGLGWI